MASAPYVLPVPTGHRSDWGEAFATALDTRLQELQPRSLDRNRTGTFTESGGRLIVRLVSSPTGEAIEVSIWEDEADVRWRNKVEKFRLQNTSDPASWIPAAIECVEQALADGDFV